MHRPPRSQWFPDALDGALDRNGDAEQFGEFGASGFPVAAELDQVDFVGG